MNKTLIILFLLSMLTLASCDKNQDFYCEIERLEFTMTGDNSAIYKGSVRTNGSVEKVELAVFGYDNNGMMYLPRYYIIDLKDIRFFTITLNSLAYNSGYNAYINVYIDDTVRSGGGIDFETSQREI